MISVRPLRVEDAVFFQPSDRAHGLVHAGLSPDHAAMLIENGSAWAIEQDGVPVAVGGFVEMMALRATAWLILSRHFDRRQHGRLLARIARGKVGACGLALDCVVNDRLPLLRFAAWLGFQPFGPAIPYGDDDAPHIVLERRRA
ncbi:hypothetical protein ACSMXM_01345 [Pacificimonas sp. ICDLI1SI03]